MKNTAAVQNGSAACILGNIEGNRIDDLHREISFKKQFLNCARIVYLNDYFGRTTTIIKSQFFLKV